jgi:hypothetical protein
MARHIFLQATVAQRCFSRAQVRFEMILLKGKPSMSKRRTQKLVDYEVQSSLIVRLCMHWVLFLVATAIAMFLWVRFFESPLDSLEVSFNKYLSTLIPLVVVALALLPVFVLDAVKLSNRFTGPILRLRRTLASLAEGQPVKPLEFRSNDFWRSLADDFNRVISLKTSPSADAPPTNAASKS